MMGENVLFLKTEAKVLTVVQYVQCLKSTVLLYSSPVRPSILLIKSKLQDQQYPLRAGFVCPWKTWNSKFIQKKKIVEN